MLLRKPAIICCHIFPPHLINASTLPCETENIEIVSFHANENPTMLSKVTAKNVGDVFYETHCR